jgi:hypothetical protein
MCSRIEESEIKILFPMFSDGNWAKVAEGTVEVDENPGCVVVEAQDDGASYFLVSLMASIVCFGPQFDHSNTWWSVSAELPEFISPGFPSRASVRLDS